jgi:cleavage and polyadenylation specificity factor subunit 3
MPLGAGCEVGRSCIYLECKGRKILLDCGLHPAREGIQALPYFDAIKPEELDILLLTHFHVDHCAGLPYFLEKTGFKGKVFTTHPTKSIYNYIAQDFVKVSNISTDEQIFNQEDVIKSLKKIQMIDFHQEVEEREIKFTAYRAVLGASMFLVEIDGVRILYTGDYSREEDRHLKPAEIP